MKQEHVQRRVTAGSGPVRSIRRILRATAAWIAGVARIAHLPDLAGAEDRRVRSAIAELQRFKDYELADIGLSRGDLTPEGLRIAGERRAAGQ